MNSIIEGFLKAFSLIVDFDPELIGIILLSLEVSGIALVIASSLGIPAGSFLGLKKFRGRGFIQLTGKSNYTNFTKFIGEDCVSNPDLVSTKYPLASAAFFFNNNNLWSICDKGADVATVTAVTKRVNGGVIGINDRIKHFNEFYKLLS